MKHESTSGGAHKAWDRESGMEYATSNGLHLLSEYDYVTALFFLGY